MRRFFTFLFLISGSAAQAHPGHLADLAGHDHWVAGAAIGLAILTGIYGALKGKSQPDPDEPVDDEQLDEEEVPA